MMSEEYKKYEREWAKRMFHQKPVHSNNLDAVRCELFKEKIINTEFAQKLSEAMNKAQVKK